MVDQTIAELAPIVGTRAACAALGRSRATHYRRHRQSPPPPRPQRVPKPQPRALTHTERAAVLGHVRHHEVSGMGYRELSRMEIIEVVRRPDCDRSAAVDWPGYGRPRLAAWERHRLVGSQRKESRGGRPPEHRDAIRRLARYCAGRLDPGGRAHRLASLASSGSTRSFAHLDQMASDRAPRGASVSTTAVCVVRSARDQGTLLRRATISLQARLRPASTAAPISSVRALA